MEVNHLFLMKGGKLSLNNAHPFGYLNLFYIKNSSVERDNGQVRLVRGRSIDISITRRPRNTGSVMFKPLGLYTSSFCIAMYADTFRRH